MRYEYIEIPAKWNERKPKEFKCRNSLNKNAVNEPCCADCSLTTEMPEIRDSSCKQLWSGLLSCTVPMKSFLTCFTSVKDA